MLKKTLIVLFILFALVSSSQAFQLNTIKPLPSTMVAGSSYVGIYEISDYTGQIDIAVQISNPDYQVSFNETHVAVVVDNVVLNCTEQTAGAYDCGSTSISNTILSVILSTHLAIYPSENYAYTIEVGYYEEEVKKVYRVGGGPLVPRDTDDDGISDLDEMLAGTDPNNPCDPNPECAACLALRPVTPTPIATPEIIIEITPTPEPTVTPTVPTPPEKKFNWWIIVSIVLSIILICSAYYWWRKREKKKDSSL